MKLLTAVNNILPFLGESLVADLDDTSNENVARCLQYIESERQSMLTTERWFNTTKTTFYPDTDGRILYPVFAYKLYPKDRVLLTKRGQYLVDMTNGRETFTGPVEARLVIDTQFEDLPEENAEYVLWSAGLLVYGSDLGVDANAQLMQQKVQDASTRMLREELRMQRFNSQNSRAGATVHGALRGLYDR